MNQDVTVRHQTLEEDLDFLKTEKMENDFDLRKVDLQLKIVNAKANLYRAETERQKVKLEEQKVMLEMRRVALEERNFVVSTAKDLMSKNEKVKRIISKVMVGLLPKDDESTLAILKACDQITELSEAPV